MTSWACQQVSWNPVYNARVYGLVSNNDENCCTNQTATKQWAAGIVTYTAQDGSGRVVTLEQQATYQELFFDEYGRDPTAAELAAITSSEALLWYENWVASMSKLMFPNNYVITFEAAESETTITPCQICWTKRTDFCLGPNPDPNSNDGIPLNPVFTGRIKFPDGSTCPVNGVNYADQLGLDPCGNTNLTVTQPPGCPECN